MRIIIYKIERKRIPRPTLHKRNTNRIHSTRRRKNHTRNRNNGYKGIAYEKITPVLAGAIQEQENKINLLEQKNQKLEEQYNQISARLTALKELACLNHTSPTGNECAYRHNPEADACKNQYTSSADTGQQSCWYEELCSSVMKLPTDNKTKFTNFECFYGKKIQEAFIIK